MSIFKKTTSLADRRNSRDALIKKLEAVTTALDAARNNAVELAADGADDNKQNTANRLIDQLATDVEVLHNAIAKVEMDIARIEEEEKHAAEKIEREATSKSLNKMAEVYEKSIVQFPVVIQEILKAYENAKSVTGETGLPVILTNMAKEVSEAVATFAADLRARATQTLAGSAPSSLPKPFVPEVVKPVPEEPTIQIFALQRLSWKDAHGNYKNCTPFQITNLPVAAAETAFKRGLAIDPNSERAVTMRNNKNIPHLLDAQKTFDLDSDPNAQFAIGHNGELKPFFEPYHRGEPFKITIPRDPDLEVAQR